MKGKQNPDRKGSTVKPNTNANEQMDLAADVTTEPQQFEKGVDALRAQEAPENQQATEREEAEK